MNQQVALILGEKKGGGLWDALETHFKGCVLKGGGNVQRTLNIFHPKYHRYLASNSYTYSSIPIFHFLCLYFAQREKQEKRGLGEKSKGDSLSDEDDDNAGDGDDTAVEHRKI